MRKHVMNFALLAALAVLPALSGCGRGGQTPSTSAGGGGATVLPPEFNKEITALDGSKTTLAKKYPGKVVLVNFWATWCEPCRGEIPYLIGLNEKYASKGLVIVGVAMDEEGKKKVEPYVAKERFDVNGKPEAMNYDIMLGTDSFAEKFGGLIGMPTSVLYARDGRKVMTKIGSLLVDPDKFSKALEAQF
jgi:thiol-disulfide isomerase/thioredoxin